jgi:aspartate carbamoyltransferase catalytic subunit
VVAPPELSLRAEFKAELEERNVAFREIESVDTCIAEADVIYMEPVVQADYTQSRVEPTADHALTPAAYQVTKELLHAKAKRDAIILHSLPRMDELPPAVDSTRHARYWFEAYNGVVVRMALLALVLGAIE